MCGDQVGEGELSIYRAQIILSQARVGEGEEFSTHIVQIITSQARGVGEYKVQVITLHASSYSTHQPSPRVGEGKEFSTHIISQARGKGEFSTAGSFP